MSLKSSEINNCSWIVSAVLDACVLRAPPGSHRPVLVAHPGANTFPSVCGLTTTSFTDPSASRNTFSVSTITDGNARVGGRSTFLALTLAWLYIEPSPCGGVRPASDPVDSDPGAVFEDDPHPRSDAGRPLEPWVCRQTREPTVLSRLSCRPPHLNVDRFHQPCLFPYAHFWGRWGLSSPYHVAATYPCGQPGSSSFASHWRFFATPTRRYHGRMLIHPSHPCVCHRGA